MSFPITYTPVFAERLLTPCPYADSLLCVGTYFLRRLDRDMTTGS